MKKALSKVIMSSFFFFLCTNIKVVYAENERTEESIPISMEYYSGPILIYDCDLEAFICTTSFDVKRCEAANRERKKEIRNILFKQNHPLPPQKKCLLLREYKTQVSCHKKQQKMVNHFQVSSFCQLDWRP